MSHNKVAFQQASFFSANYSFLNAF